MLQLHSLQTEDIPSPLVPPLSLSPRLASPPACAHHTYLYTRHNDMEVGIGLEQLVVEPGPLPVPEEVTRMGEAQAEARRDESPEGGHQGRDGAGGRLR